MGVHVTEYSSHFDKYGEYLRIIMRDGTMTWKELADDIGLSAYALRNFFSWIEKRGKSRHHPQPATLRAIKTYILKCHALKQEKSGRYELW